MLLRPERLISGQYTSALSRLPKQLPSLPGAFAATLSAHNLLPRNVFETLGKENGLPHVFRSIWITAMPGRPQLEEKEEVNLPEDSCIQSPSGADRVSMTTWQKHDWKQYFEIARRPWQRLRPPRPVYPTGINRVLPAAGFSLSELDDAGINLDQAEELGLPVDAGRIGAYGPNVSALRGFALVSRRPL
jgi:ribosomal protein L13E